MKEILAKIRPFGTYEKGTKDAKANLHEHIFTAIELEHATLPPYFTAWASLKPDLVGNKDKAKGYIREVMVEEMIHMSLAANMMIATGGESKIANESFIPGYPARLPEAASGTVFANIAPCSNALLDTFVLIEQPSEEPVVPAVENYETIGQFYYGLWLAFVEVYGEDLTTKIYEGDTPPNQITGMSGLKALETLGDVRDAIDLILEQGEGQHLPEDKLLELAEIDCDNPPGDDDSHYVKFLWLTECCEFDENDVYDFPANPGDPDLPNEEYEEASKAFNETYSKMLRELEVLFSEGGDAYGTAWNTMRTLTGDGEALMMSGYGPTFKYID